MSDEEDYSSDDDVDYVPTVGEEVSEEEGSGDEEDLDALNEDAKQDGKVGGRRERSKKKNDLAPRKRQGGIKLDGEEEPDDPPHGEPESWDLMQEIAKEKEAKKEKQEKKRADDLWSSFMSDMKTPPPRKTSSTGLGVLASMVKPTNINPKQSPSQATPESGITTSTKMTITKVFDFAGEEVKVTKEVDVTSREAQEEIKKQENSSAEAKSSTPSTSEKPSGLSGIGVKRPAAGAGGLGGLLNKIGKKPKMSVLEKSKMDWNTFKKDKGIEDDLQIHNRGKESYLERMAFLNRADVRQFEIEKSLRLSKSKR
ncbi:craniofacial development protein 1-like isoform X1 [Haliotis rubra]|uniref:craniofacial development protein 1-like isoform X1 n=1 Tax=Haliotis rubra TaxID=36100 RepID=UPI001EE58E12|nr:craniofacial development protein 1-like isoform X1 [Haliotis rubra]